MGEAQSYVWDVDKCQICNPPKTFNTKSNFYRHVRDIHKEQVGHKSEIFTISSKERTILKGTTQLTTQKICTFIHTYIHTTHIHTCFGSKYRGTLINFLKSFPTMADLIWTHQSKMFEDILVIKGILDYFCMPEVHYCKKGWISLGVDINSTILYLDIIYSILPPTDYLDPPIIKSFNLLKVPLYFEP